MWFQVNTLIMIRLTTLAVLFLSCSTDPRSPRIYNVLISSKKNLSPSHAQPVYEPVLRTTSLGYAFPSLIYHTSLVHNVPFTYINPDYSGYRKIDASFLNQNGEVTGNNVPLSVSTSELELNKQPLANNIPQNQQQSNQEDEQGPIGQFLPQYNPYQLNYIKYLPKEQDGEAGGQNRFPALAQEETDPKKVIANLKKNPEIPDVPPPPLPVRISTKQ